MLYFRKDLKMALYHKHLIIRAEVGTPIKDPNEAKEWLVKLIDSIDMKLLQCISANPNAGYCDLEGNRGLTAVALIETSHIVMHIWDEGNPSTVQLDVYTCGCLDIATVFKALDVMNPSKIDYKFIDREYNVQDITPVVKKEETWFDKFLNYLRLPG